MVKLLPLLTSLLFWAVLAQAESDPVALLRDYVRINTTNPPGNEARAVEFLGKQLDAAGIAYDTVQTAPGRANLWARLPGGDKPALLLLHHTDVVAAEADAWVAPPFAGDIVDGHVYGRGALDMKGQGIMHLLAFIALHGSGQPLNRDVIFMATADEEAGSEFGMGWMVANRPDLFEGVGFTLTEGGGGVVVNGQRAFNIEVTQKFPVWLRLTATGTPGHGSTPRSDAAVDRLLRALYQIQSNPPEPRIIPAVDQYFRELASRFPGRMGAAMADIGTAIKDPAFAAELQRGIPQLNALTRNTCAITRLAGSPKVNVLPAQASAEIDCRLLPDEDPQAFVAGLKQLVNDDKVTIKTLLVLAPASSPQDTPLYRTIVDVLSRHYPDATSGPSVSTGFTDSHHLRKRGIVSYGFTPVVLPLADYSGIHGHNERIAVGEMKKANAIFQDIIGEMVYDKK